jgi:import inner membrane translocase subunit TIM13
MSHACFDKCVPKPGTSLSSSEQVSYQAFPISTCMFTLAIVQACIGKCADRFVEAMSMVSRTYIAKLQQSQR